MTHDGNRLVVIPMAKWHVAANDEWVPADPPLRAA